MKRATERVHPMIRHLFRGWFYLGCVMVLMAAVAALTGCGGGSMPDDTPPDPLPPLDCQARPELCK